MTKSRAQGIWNEPKSKDIFTCREWERKEPTAFQPGKVQKPAQGLGRRETLRQRLLYLAASCCLNAKQHAFSPVGACTLQLRIVNSS
jgi:hypothetical protein